MITRLDKYTLVVDGVRVTAPDYTDLEDRIRAMSDEDRERFVQVMGGETA